MKKTLYIVFLLLSFTLFAQNKDKKTEPKRKPNGEIENTEIIIEKNRKIELPEADRNFEKISESVKKPEPQAQRYTFQDFTLRLPVLNPKFQLLPPPAEEPVSQFGNYARAGFGNYTTSSAELFLNNTQNPNFNYGFQGKHLASTAGAVRKEESASAEQKAEIFGKYKSGFLQTDVSLAYNRQATRFYGFTPSPNIDYDVEKLKHIYNTIDFRSSLKNRALDSLLGFQIGINLANIADNLSSKEFEFGGKIGFDYVVNENLTAVIESDIFLTKFQNNKQNLNRNYLKIKPEVRFRKNGFSLNFGLNVVNQNDTAKTLKSTNLYPAIKLAYRLSRSAEVFAGFSGDVERNTLRKFVSENLWLSQNFILQNTEKPIDISAGFRLNISQSFSLALQFNFEKYKNLYFYTNTKSDTSQFEVLYEPVQSTVLHPQLEIAYSQPKFRLGLKTDFYNYQLSTIAEPFHRPTFTATVFAKYYFAENLVFSTDFYYLGRLNALNPVGGKPVSLKPIADLNLKAEYQLTEQFSVFLSVNNIFSQNYQRYLNYPVRGFQVLGGISFLF